MNWHRYRFASFGVYLGTDGTWVSSLFHFLTQIMEEIPDSDQLLQLGRAQMSALLNLRGKRYPEHCVRQGISLELGSPLP